MSYSVRVVIIIGFVLSLSVGFIDIAISLLSESSGLSSFSFILPPLVVTIGVFLLIYVILWFLVASHIERFLKFEAIPLALSLAVFLGIIFTLASLNNLIHPSLSITDLFKLFILFLISLWISAGAYFLTKAVVLMPNYKNTAVVFGLATPFVLAETVVFVWLHMHRIESFFSIKSFLFNIVYMLTVLLTWVLLYRIEQLLTIMKLLTVFLILIVLSPFVTLIPVQAAKHPLIEYKNKNHQIKHVILIVVDTLRPDVLSCYNHQGISTPHIDQLARDGILFTKAISAGPWTLPSLASIMTGLFPSVHMATRYSSKLPDALPTLAKYMRGAGYFTGAIGSNWFLNPDSNISQGFLEYNFFPKPSMGSSFGARLLQQLFPNQFRTDVTAHDLTELTINWLESNYGKDFFLWIHYFDPHGPYSPPAKFLPKMEPPPRIGTNFSKFTEIRSGVFVPSLAEREWIKDLYKGEVNYVDENIGRLINALKRRNLYDESLIIFMSDHGEEFWEHGSVEHGHTLYNELLWVPLIIKLPLSTSKRQISVTVPTQSIMPTILDLCKIDFENNNLSVGSLSPLWKSNPHALEEQPIISTGQLCYEDRESVFFDGLKYIHSLLTNREELYDMARDPQEQNSIASSSPDKLQRARNILREHNKIAKNLRKRYRIRSKEEAKFDKEKIQGLKSLGYIQ